MSTTPRARPVWRSVAVPDEHGGWGLTAEPALLGLLVAPSWAGGALAVGALIAFLVRTPLKVVLVDRWRHRWLPRSRLALGIAGVELALLFVVALFAVSRAGWAWTVPIAVAVPLVGVELWFDMRSRSRRLIPELCGAIGIAAVAASIALAGGTSARFAIALWLVLAARAVATIPFVRTQIGRLRHGSLPTTPSDLGQAAGIVVAFVAIATDQLVFIGALAVMALACAQFVWVRRPPVPAKRLGLRLLFLGLAIVAITAAGVHLA
jgi:hypothetical protein